MNFEKLVLKALFIILNHIAFGRPITWNDFELWRNEYQSWLNKTK